jgi:hypothetical protein
VGTWLSPEECKLYVGDLIVGEIASGWEGPCGIAVSMHCRMMVLLGNVNETYCATRLQMNLLPLLELR